MTPLRTLIMASPTAVSDPLDSRSRRRSTWLSWPTTSAPTRLATLTRTFAAAAILRMCERGRLDLDAASADLRCGMF